VDPVRGKVSSEDGENTVRRGVNSYLEVIVFIRKSLPEGGVALILTNSITINKQDSAFVRERKQKRPGAGYANDSRDKILIHHA